MLAPTSRFLLELDSKADRMQRGGSQLGLIKCFEGKISPECHEGKHGDLKRWAKICRMTSLKSQTNWAYTSLCLIVLLFGGWTQSAPHLPGYTSGCDTIFLMAGGKTICWRAWAAPDYPSCPGQAALFCQLTNCWQSGPNVSAKNRHNSLK